MKHPIPLLALLAVGLSCGSESADVECLEHANCNLESGGLCVEYRPTGHKWCQYPDESCDTGMRWSDFDTGDGLSGICVDSPDGGAPPSDAQTPQDGGTDASILVDATGSADAVVDAGNSAINWVAIGAGLMSDIAVGAVVAPDGNVIAAGRYSDTINLGGVDLDTYGNADFFLAKFRGEDGVHVWSEHYGSSNVDWIEAMDVDAAGNIYVVGRYAGTPNYGGTDLPNGGGNDIFIAKFSGANGAHVWSRGFGGTGFDYCEGHAVAVANDGVVLACTFVGTASFGGAPLVADGNDDMVLAKYAFNNGAHLWSKHYGGAGSVFPRAVTIDPSGNVLVTGGHTGTANLGGQDLESAGSTDVFIAKYSGTNGNHIWSFNYGGTGQDYGRAVAATNSDVVVSGYYSNVAVDFGGGTRANQGGQDMFVAKYENSSGAHVWSDVFGDPAAQRGHAVILEGTNTVVAAAMNGTVNFGGGPLESAGSTDIAIVTLATGDGAYVGADLVGGEGLDEPYSIDSYPYGVVTGGSFEGSTDFGFQTATSAGAEDAFILHLAK